MTDSGMVTLLQAAQLAALGPCLFIIAFLLLVARSYRTTIIPILYFISLSCSFLLPLLPLFSVFQLSAWPEGLLMWGESLQVTLGFLLIMQLVLGGLPSWLYWLVLAVPVIGGTTLVYGALQADEFCLSMGQCLPAFSVRIFYNLFSSALVFLLLIVDFQGRRDWLGKNPVHRAHKYWLIVALISLNLCLLAVDLLRLSEWWRPAEADWAQAMIRIGFIYLVLTSLFRVFDHSMSLALTRIPTLARNRVKEGDELLLQQLRGHMEIHKLYREMGLSRSVLAERLGIRNAEMSRLINVHFGQNFNEYVNRYRIEEAKHRLTHEQVPVTTIAFEVGFSSIASFNRVFKDMVGVTPTAFREAHQPSKV